MRARLWAQRTALVAGAVLGAAALAQPASQSIHTAQYETRGPELAGSAQLVAPDGATYVYESQQMQDRRSPQRMVLSRPARDEYVLFSAEEEEVLWNLRERQLAQRAAAQAAANQPTPASAPAARPRSRMSLRIDWPRVVVTGEKTCVPRLEFSSAADWKDHLVCWIVEKSVSSEDQEIPRHADAGVAFLGVEMGDATIVIVSVFLGLIAGSFLGAMGFIGIPAVGYFLNKAYLDWRGNALPGQFRARLYSLGLVGYSRAFAQRNVLFVGDNCVINPASGDLIKQAQDVLARRSPPVVPGKPAAID